MVINGTKDFVKEYIQEEHRSLQNGKAKLSKVVNFLNTRPFIDSEDITYYPKDFPFRAQDFRDVFKYLETQAKDKMQSSKGDVFPECLAYFNLAGTKFIWRLLVGQGSATQLILANNNHEYKKEFEIKL